MARIPRTCLEDRRHGSRRRAIHVSRSPEIYGIPAKGQRQQISPHLRLEVEKLRRAEAEWLQIMIHILDHVFAVFQAAHRSGQASLADQMGQFQNSCRDAARRIGLVATLGKTGDPFDPNLHKLVDNASPNGNAIIADTLATGYTFQGQIIRRPLVALKPYPSE